MTLSIFLVYLGNYRDGLLNKQVVTNLLASSLKVPNDSFSAVTDRK